MFKIGVIIDAFVPELATRLPQIRQLGIEGIQFQAAQGSLALETMTPQKKKELKKQIHDSGLQVSALCADFGGHGFAIKKDNAFKIDQSKRILEWAKELDCSIATTHIGVIPAQGESRENQLEACYQLGNFASSLEGCFAIETGPETCLELKGFLDELRTSGVGVNFDPANLVMVTDDDPSRGVLLLKDYIVHTHAKDGKMIKKTSPQKIYDYFASGGIEDLNLPDYFSEEVLGQGEVNFPEYLKALTTIGYEGFLTIERELGQDYWSDLVLAVNYLKQLIKE